MRDEDAESPGPPDGEEHRRIRRVYGGYQDDPHRRRIWSDTPAERLSREGKWRRIQALLAGTGADLAGAWGLDLGSGATADADRLSPADHPLRGIVVLDLLHERLAEARRSNAALIPAA